MLFEILNTFMLLIGCIALYCGYVHVWRESDYLGIEDELWVMIGITTGSIFCAYATVWGIASSVSSLFSTVKYGVGALMALLSPH